MNKLKTNCISGFMNKYKEDTGQEVSGVSRSDIATRNSLVLGLCVSLDLPLDIVSLIVQE